MKSENIDTAYSSIDIYAKNIVEIRSEQNHDLYEIIDTTSIPKLSEVAIIFDPRKEKQIIYRIELKQEIRRRAYLRQNKKPEVR